MIHISCLDDLSQLDHDPELYREVYGYLSVCLAGSLKDQQRKAQTHEWKWISQGEAVGK